MLSLVFLVSPVPFPFTTKKEASVRLFNSIGQNADADGISEGLAIGQNADGPMADGPMADGPMDGQI